MPNRQNTTLLCLVQLYYAKEEVLDITLQVECCRLVDAEILQGLGDGIAHLLGDSEEMIHRIAAGEDDCCIFWKLDMLLTKFAGCDAFQFDEFLKGEIHAIFFHHVAVRGLCDIRRLWL